MSLPKSDSYMTEHPFTKLGFGVHSYLNFMLHLMTMMGLIMFFSVPLMLFYASYSDLVQDTESYFFNQFSLGNLGGSTSLCQV